MTSLSGKSCVVTGASSGIGVELARGLAAQGARLALVGRDKDRLHEVADSCRSLGAPEVEVYPCDFASLEEVRDLADRLLADLPEIHVLANNAGGVVQRRQETVDGYERIFAVNHLAPYLLTRLLLDRLTASAPARVITTASDAHEFGPIDPDDYMCERARFRPLKVYGRSKLANILMTTQLARVLEGTGVTAVSFHPGFVSTSIGRDNPLGILFLKALRPFIKSPTQGADTGVWLATTEAIDNGGYYVKRRVHRVKNDGQDPALAQRLWDDSAALVGLG
jgi:NAD(P)-dependent dehydrogenase (short-subunit alcohol dehydrogenase family)